MSDNLNLWKSVAHVPPEATKPFTRAGGFKGTAINPTYLARMATERWGPIGLGWGMNILEEKWQPGEPFLLDGEVIGHSIIHILKCELWYFEPDMDRASVIQFGQTTFVGRNSYGFFTDEEAPKKSLTDAMSKCLSLLGFAAEIYTGIWDDKYSQDPSRVDDDAPQPKRPARKKAAAKAPPRAAPVKSHDDQTAVQMAGKKKNLINRINGAPNLAALVKAFEDAKTLAAELKDAAFQKEVATAKDKRKAQLSPEEAA